MTRTLSFACLILTLCSCCATGAAATEYLPPLADTEESAAELPSPEGSATPQVVAPVIEFGAASVQISAGSIQLSFDELADTSTLQLRCDRAVQAGNLWYAAGQDLAFAASEGESDFTLNINGQGGLTLVPGVYRLSAQVESSAGVPSAWVRITLEVNAESEGSALAHADLLQGQQQTVVVSGAGVGNALSADFGSEIQVGNLTRQDDDHLAVALTVGGLAATGTREFVLQLASCASTGSLEVLLPCTDTAQPGTAPHRNAAQSQDGVLLADGAWRWQQCDLRTRGRMLDLAADRTYRGSGDCNGPLGRNWFGRYFERATLGAGQVNWTTPDGWCHTFSSAGNGLYLPPAGVYAVVRHDTASGSLTLSERDGTRHQFAADGRLLCVHDRHGNATRLHYDCQGRLAIVCGDRGTQWLFDWHAHGRVAAITDISWSPPRIVQFQYDSDGNLTSVLWPETAAFNQERENRVTWQFGYDAPGRLQRIVWPAQQASDVAALTFGYDGQNRVTSLTRGQQVTRLGYGSGQVNEFDPRGLRTCFELDQAGHATAVTRFNGLWQPGETSPELTAQPLRAGETQQSWTTSEGFGANHEITQRQQPGGRQEQWDYPTPVQQICGSLDTLQGRLAVVQNASWTSGQWRNFYLRVGNTTSGYRYHLIRGNSADELELWTAPTAANGLNYAIFKDNPDPLAAGNVLAHKWIGTSNELEYEAFSYEPAYQLRKSRRSRAGAWWLYRFDHEGDNASGTGNEVEELSPPVTVAYSQATPFTVRVRTTRRFNYQGQPTSQVDAEGVETAFHYHTQGVSVALPSQTVVDPGGLALTSQLTWDAAGQPASQWSPRAFVAGSTADDYRTDFVFNQLGWKVQQTGPCLRPGGSDRADTHFLYDANGNLTHVMREYVTDAGEQPDAPGDPTDVATYPRNANAMAATWIEETREYNLLNRQTALVEDAITGEVIHRVRREYSYDDSGNLSHITSPLGRVTATLFDERNLPLEISQALGSPVQGDKRFAYDADGCLVASIDERGKSTTRSYDGLGRLLRVTRPTGEYRQATWTAAGLVASETAFDAADTTLARTEWAYDEIDRLVQDRTLAKTAAGADIGSGWNTCVYTRDRMGRVVACSTGNAVEQYTHDNAGRLVAHVDAAGDGLAATWDADGNLTTLTGTEVVTADNTTESGTWSADYDPCGRRVAQRDRRNREGFSTELTMTYDGLSRLTRCQRGDRGIRQHYDLRGRPTDTFDDTGAWFSVPAPRQVHDDDDMDPVPASFTPGEPVPLAVTRQYDDRGRLIAQAGPGAGQRVWAYDEAGNPTQCELEDGTVVTQQYDDNGRVVAREVQFADQSLGVLEEEFTWDGLGRLVAGFRQALGVRVQSTFQYNTAGVCTGTGQSVYVGQQLLDQRELADTCDEYGNLVSAGFSDATSVSISRDALGRLVGIDAGNDITATLDWAGPARPARAGLPGGVTWSRKFEPAASACIQDTTLARGSALLRASDYAWNEQAEQVSYTHRTRATRQLTRGSRGQVIQVAVSGSGGPAQLRQFASDPWRNLTSVTESLDSNVILTRQYNPDAANLGRWTSADDVTLGWDSMGCLNEVQGSHIAWDQNYQPMIAAAATGWQQPTLQISYDVVGRPVLFQRPVAGTLALLVYGPDGTQREEHRGTGQGFAQSRYEFGLGAGCVMQRENGHRATQIRNGQGSLEAVLDAEGHRLLEVDYLDDGTPLAARILLDLDPAGLTLSNPVPGVLKIQTPFDLNTGIDWPGLELETWWQDEEDTFRIATSILTAGTDWLLVDDADGKIFAALQAGASAVVLDCRHAPGEWATDRQSGLSTLTLSSMTLDESFVGGFVAPDIDNPCWLEIVSVDVQAATLVVRGDVSALPQARWRAFKGALAAGLEGERLWHGLRLIGTPQGSQGHARMLWHLGRGQVHIPLLLGAAVRAQCGQLGGAGMDSPANLMAEAITAPGVPKPPETAPSMR